MTDPAPQDSILSYQNKSSCLSGLAIFSLVLAILAALTFFLVIPSVLAFILAVIADARIKKNPYKLAGRGYTTAAVTLSVCTFCFGLVFAFLLPSLISERGYAGRSYCASNLRGIASAMVIYSATNSDQFPIVTYAPYSPALNSPTAAAASTNADDVIKNYYKAPFPQAGSVTANLWILVLSGASPKLFICRGYDGKLDPYVTGPAETLDSRKNYFNNFQNDKQLSYSAAYPWKADGTVGKWWSNTADASLPLMSDMAPENGTGSSPKVNVVPASKGGLPPGGPRAWCSPNHQRDGQNVVYGDVHVDYTKRADVGQDSDNIWTTSAFPSTGPSDFGIPATKSSPALTNDAPPYDIIMLPIRNLDTGHL